MKRAAKPRDNVALKCLSRGYLVREPITGVPITVHFHRTRASMYSLTSSNMILKYGPMKRIISPSKK